MRSRKLYLSLHLLHGNRGLDATRPDRPEENKGSVMPLVNIATFIKCHMLVLSLSFSDLVLCYQSPYHVGRMKHRTYTVAL